MNRAIHQIIPVSIVDQIAPSGLLTTAQAATYLGISPATLTIWRSTNRRILTYVKVGGNVRYRREDLEKFISANLRNPDLLMVGSSVPKSANEMSLALGSPRTVRQSGPLRFDKTRNREEVRECRSGGSFPKRT